VKRDVKCPNIFMNNKIESDSKDILVDEELLAKDLAESIVKGALSLSIEVDRFSSWFLAGPAAAIVFVLANIKGLIPSISNPDLRIIISTLGISILFGICEKYMAFSISLNRRMGEFADGLFDKWLKRHVPEEYRFSTKPYDYFREKIDKKTMISYLITAFPKFMHRSLISQMMESDGTLSKYKEEFHKFVRQAIYLTFQVLCGIGAIIILLLSI